MSTSCFDRDDETFTVLVNPEASAPFGQPGWF